MSPDMFDLIKGCLIALITAVVGGLFTLKKTKRIDNEEKWRRDVNNNTLPKCASILKKHFYDAILDTRWIDLPFNYEYRATFDSNICELEINIFNTDKMSDADNNKYTARANECFLHIYECAKKDIDNIKSKYDINVNIVGDCKIGVIIQNKIR